VKHPALPFAWHERVGLLMIDMTDTLMKTFIAVANSKRSKRQKKAALLLEKALREVNKARSELEEMMFEEHPDRASVHIYYGRKPK